jgi:hypothetical protein
MCFVFLYNVYSKRFRCDKYLVNYFRNVLIFAGRSLSIVNISVVPILNNKFLNITVIFVKICSAVLVTDRPIGTDNNIYSICIISLWAPQKHKWFGTIDNMQCWSHCLFVLGLLDEIRCLKTGSTSISSASDLRITIRMCVCACVCMYVCMYVCVYVYMYVCLCMYVSTYVCMYVYMYVCLCMYVCIYVCVYVCMYIRVYVCMCVCIYVFMCVYVHILSVQCAWGSHRRQY